MLQMRRTPTLIALFAALAVLAAACGPPAPAPAPPRPVVTTRPPPPPPPPAPPPPGLPAAPGGAAASAVVASTTHGPDAIDFPDPFVFRPSAAGSPWYAYATGAAFVDLQMMTSSDLVNWTLLGDPLPGASNNWADLFANSWAPSVIERPNNAAAQRFVMYYTAHDRATGQQCIGRATSASPAGPFSDERTSALICQYGGSIDPSPFVASDGTLWLVFSNTTPATSLWSVQMTSDGLSTVGQNRWLLSTAARTWEGPLIEAPTMISSPTGLQLYYSANPYNTSAYAVGVARCTGPAGPCSRIYSTPVLATRSTMAGPGGQTPFQDGSGNWQVVFHAWTSPFIGYDGNPFNKDRRRTLRFLPLTFPNGLPKIG